MTENIRTLTEENFDEVIASGTTLVDFWAGWCAPCRMVAPVIDELADEYAGKATVGKVDIDSEMQLAMRFGVMSIPTVIAFKDGAEVSRAVGVRDKKEYEDMLK